MNFESKVLNTIEEFAMVSKEDSILIALSGGSDSVSLLHCLALNFSDKHKIFAAHMNHQIRGEDADNDENFCKSLCCEYKIKFFTKKSDIPKIAKENSESIEETARHERYKFLSEIADQIQVQMKTEKNNGNVKIATAHNANDNTESVILNVSRGSGLNGLRGILPIRENIIRPMIKCTKSEVWEYIKCRKLKYITDKTNSEDVYTRNFIRHSVVENLSARFPNVHKNISKMTKLISYDVDFIESYVENILLEKKITHCINIDLLFSFHEAIRNRILQHMYSYALDSNIKDKVKNALELKHIEIILYETTNRTNKKNKVLDLPNEIILEISYENIIFKTKSDKQKKSLENFLFYPKKGTNFIEEIGLKISFDFEKDESFIKGYKRFENIYNLFNNVVLDSDKIKGVIFLRIKHEGDKYSFNNQSKSVKKNYINKKIQKSLRDTLPLLCDDYGIIWACGLPVADRVKVDKNTRNILKITTNVKL